jgi:O-antigen biosynthesis protein WbqP
VLLLCWAAVRLTSPGPALHWSERVGKDNHLFRMPKFRTMRVETPQVATHLLREPSRFLTPVGAFLRKSSLDELPQLFSVCRGDLSLVGPRPALYNQHDLVALRSRCGVHRLVPGVTGWAQINGRD